MPNKPINAGMPLGKQAAVLRYNVMAGGYYQKHVINGRTTNPLASRPLLKSCTSCKRNNIYIDSQKQICDDCLHQLALETDPHLRSAHQYVVNELNKNKINFGKPLA